ncbi:hypothetical protein [Fimbriiglobus ruber]|uniref:Uncharacterized protein n=1 Tax=Fimbriiglobus ruber TaxID=1908690 RepID=A0A225DJ07_9BACT|nr:hypothetical protein [Fimbriiglobus ruber]OWK38558.1 hypothetical protein FRUB_07678 [Fimbriiglobus ruber]
MKLTRRRKIWAAALLIVTAVVVWAARSGWERWVEFRGHIPGRYRAFPAEGTTVFTVIAPDGTWTMDVHTSGTAQPKMAMSGRWRLSGHMLIFLSGAAADESVGPLAFILESLQGPLNDSEVSRIRVVSASAAGLELSYGTHLITGKEDLQTLKREPAAP